MVLFYPDKETEPKRKKIDHRVLWIKMAAIKKSCNNIKQKERERDFFFMNSNLCSEYCVHNIIFYNNNNNIYYLYTIRVLQ